MPCVEHHGFCKHTASSWNLALSAALACAGKSLPTSERQSKIRQIMNGEDVWIRGVHFHKA